MLSSLKVKRAFWLIDVALVVCIAFLAAKIVIAMGTPPPTSSPSLPDADSGQQRSSTPKMKPAQHYLAISERGIFGEAGTSKAAANKKPRNSSKSPDELPPTALDLKLLGTAVGEPELTTALIENRTSRTADVYKQGDKVAPTTTIERILARQVVLNRDGNREVLTLEEEEETPSRPRPLPRSGPRGSPRVITRPDRPGTAVVRRSEWMDVDVDELRGDSEVTPVWRDGRVEGLQLSNIESNEYARQLGLEEGDVVVSVNGIKIRSIDEAFTVANRLQRAPNIRVEVLRQGKTRTLTYNVQ